MKVLFILGGGIGNIIQCTPAIQSLIKNKYIVDLLLHCNSTNDLEIFRIQGIRNIFSPKQSINGTYDYQLNGPFTPGKRYKAKKFLRTATHAKHYQEAKLYYNLLYQMGIKDEVPETKINLVDTGQKIDPKAVAIYPGSKHNWAMKRWNKFDELAKHFELPLLVGTKKDIISHGNPAWITKQWDWKNPVHKFQGSLQESAWVISQCKMFIGNDGGLAHIAASLIPTFIIFGPSSVKKNTPYNKNAYAISYNIIHKNKLDCQPCQFRKEGWFGGDKIGCPFGMKCMVDLSVQDVLKFIHERI